MIAIRNRGSHPFFAPHRTKDRTRFSAACKAPPFQLPGEKSSPARMGIDRWITVERANRSSDSVGSLVSRDPRSCPYTRKRTRLQRDSGRTKESVTGGDRTHGEGSEVPSARPSKQVVY